MTAGLREIAPHERLHLERGDGVVCIPVFGGFELFAECFAAVCQHTPGHVVVIVADDASETADVARLLRDLDARRALRLPVVYVRQPRNLGFVGNVNSIFKLAAPADVVILNSDCVVGEGWYEGLRSAAYSDGTVATATALTNHGSILSVPYRNRPIPALPQDWTLDQAAAAVRAVSPRLRPHIPTAIGHCTYVRRAALDLVGVFDEAFSPGYGEEVDFSRRCIRRGLGHVVADDVFVLHHGGGSFNERPGVTRLREDHDRLVESRYPGYLKEVEAASADRHGPLARSIAAASRAIIGMSVTVDGTCLGPQMTGTQVHTLELIGALWRLHKIRLRVLVSPPIGDYARDFLATMPDIETLRWDAGLHVPLSDVAHRPFQVNAEADIAMLRRLGGRVVITQQDLIAYRNPSYFSSYWRLQEYRRTVRDALGLADAVACFSEYVAADVVREGLVAASRCFAVPIGVDHRLSVHATPTPPRGAERLEGHEVMLCLGADFRHKNRVFAMQLAHELRHKHGWQGRLVLAGPRVSNGSSVGDEMEFLLRHPDAAQTVVRLPGVTEGEKAWLYAHARLVVYPTTVEGFGLVPFEAAEAGLPCLFAAQASLAEVLPAHLAGIIPWDVAATALNALELLRSPQVRETHVAGLREAALRYRWDVTAENLFAVYSRTVDAMPAAPFDEVVYDPSLSTLGRELVGFDGLPRQTQLALRALMRRPPYGQPIFNAMGRLYSVGTVVLERSQRLRRRRDA